MSNLLPTQTTGHYTAACSTTRTQSLATVVLQFWVFSGQPGSVEWAILESACAELDKLWRLVDEKIKVLLACVVRLGPT